MAPVPTLWGVLPWAAQRQYLWVVELRGTGTARQQFGEWVGSGFEEAMQGETSLFGVLPVHTITDFLAGIEDLDPGL
eukprot:3936475-Rhodomonas_salina.1